MKRCVWCNHIIWPWQSRSPGRVLHVDCWRYLEAITASSQSQYSVHEHEEVLLVAKPTAYEQFLGRLRDEDGD